MKPCFAVFSMLLLVVVSSMTGQSLDECPPLVSSQICTKLQEIISDSKKYSEKAGAKVMEFKEDLRKSMSKAIDDGVLVSMKKKLGEIQGKFEELLAKTTQVIRGKVDDLATALDPSTKEKFNKIRQEIRALMNSTRGEINQLLEA